jgi:hypothetical protein
MLKTFDCPKCGAPVSYEKDVIGANLTARCSYCNSSLSVPDEMRGRPAQIISHVNIDLRNTVSGGKATRWILLIVLKWSLLDGVRSRRHGVRHGLQR